MKGKMGLEVWAGREWREVTECEEEGVAIVSKADPLFYISSSEGWIQGIAFC